VDEMIEPTALVGQLQVRFEHLLGALDGLRLSKCANGSI
jgi:hypothetical protein